MAKVTELTRIIVEDFEKDHQDTVGKIAGNYNTLIEQLGRALNKGIDFDNLAQQYSVVTVTVNGSGIPTPSLQIKYDLKTKYKGAQVINAINLTDNTPLTGSPFVITEISGNIITVKQVTGLPANKQFSLSIILIG
jgi:hypothetical protein